MIHSFANRYKDLQKLKQAGLARQAKEITEILMKNPYQSPPRFEKLVGDLRDYFSRRINVQHRYIYRIIPNDGSLQDENGVIYCCRSCATDVDTLRMKS